MAINLNQKIIKDMCGTVSFKRGEAFYRANKVTFEAYSSEGCRATVAAMEDFHVTIAKDSNGDISTACSCPTLASVKSDCQHIAAVLLAINDHQRKGTTPFIKTERRESHSNVQNQELTKGLLTLFDNRSKRSSGHQLHFENRQIIEAAFICKPFTVDKGQSLIGIEAKIGPAHVQDIRGFLEEVKNGRPSRLSDTFTYDPALHCFQIETAAVIQQLIQVTHDEKVYVNAMQDTVDHAIRQHMLLVPPSSFEQLVPLLSKAPLVKLTA